MSQVKQVSFYNNNKKCLIVISSHLKKKRVFIKIRISDFFVFGQEKILDFDNSINSFVGCCSLGTGHLD